MSKMNESKAATPGNNSNAWSAVLAATTLASFWAALKVAVSQMLSLLPRKAWVALFVIGLIIGLLGSDLGATIFARQAATEDNTVSAAVAIQPFAGDLSRRLGSAGRSAERERLETLELAIAETATSAIVPDIARGIQMEIRTEIDEYEQIQQENPNRYRDLPPRVIQAGQNGETTRLYRYTEIDGEVTGAPVLEILAATRIDQIVEIGTRPRPVAPPPPPPAATPASGGGSGGGGSVGGHGGQLVTGRFSNDVWVALARCESGLRPNVISPGGRFHGLYQFSPATWRSVGGTGLPSQASPAEQRYRAVRLQARSGWGQWPACSRRLGLR